MMHQVFPKQFLNKIYNRRIAKVFLITLLAASILAFSQSSFFSLNNFTCKTQYGPCASEEVKFLEEFKNSNMVRFNAELVAVKFKQDFMNRKIIVQKIFPNTIAVTLEKRKPVIAIGITGRNDGYFLLDKDGIVIEFTKSTNLPQLSATELAGLQVGSQVNSELKSAESILYSIFRAQGVKQAEIDNHTLVAQVQSDLQVIFPLVGDSQVLTGALQLILRRSRMMDRPPKVIDLRYSKPVLKY